MFHAHGSTLTPYTPWGYEIFGVGGTRASAASASGSRSKPGTHNKRATPLRRSLRQPQRTPYQAGRTSPLRLSSPGELHAVVAVVDAALRAQLFVSAHFHHLAVVHYGNEVGVADGGKPVRNHQRGAVLAQLL